MGTTNGPGSAAATRAREHGELIQSLRHLADAIARPAPTRVAEWAREVGEALQRLEAAFARQQESAEGRDGFYEQIGAAMPRAAQRLHYLRHTNRSIAAQIRLLQEEVADLQVDEQGAFMAVRGRVTDLLGEIRQQQAREVDLLFEAFHLDIGAPD